MSREPACRREAPELFFPLGYSRAFHKQIEEAKAVCRRCPIREKCLDDVLTNPEMATDGIWAATTPPERRRMRTEVALEEAAEKKADEGLVECHECGRHVRMWASHGTLAPHSVREGLPASVDPCEGSRRRPRLTVVA
ncbi:hypothetical protein GCM10009530_63320 [Microbispora corallina]|uniref:4Fe-4S Wbl-type domain-containing protein n=1 Tax=Microbispora corallina TaxID=83302 RepID=A0ABQ4GBI1_9ACTN|nr:hypothetical protein Mco01_74380 [Microbispora corallina]